MNDEELDRMSAMYTNLCTTDTAVPQKQNDVLLAGRYRDTKDVAPTSTFSRTKKSLLFLLTTLALAVPYCKVILLEFGSDTLINTNIHHRRPDLLWLNDAVLQFWFKWISTPR